MSQKRENLLNGILHILQPEANKGLRVNVDTILLADFAKPAKREKILDIGCAHGAISLILAKRGFNIVGLDIQQHLMVAVQPAADVVGDPELQFYILQLPGLD